MGKDYKLYSTNQNIGNKVAHIQPKGDIAQVYGSTENYINVSDDLYDTIMELENKGTGRVRVHCKLEYDWESKDVVLCLWVPCDNSLPLVGMLAERTDDQALSIAETHMMDLDPIRFYY